MKIYKVICGTPYNDCAEEMFFTSREKALGYIIAKFGIHQFSGYNKKEPYYSTNTWTNDPDKLFNIRNWNKYKYVVNGIKTYIIEAVEAL